ncbi:MAG: GGDEF domain-containing protein [Rhodoferax sp.]|nr:GGDEF domain-containing protein [Rhodoferax sp.]
MEPLPIDVIALAGGVLVLLALGLSAWFALRMVRRQAERAARAGQQDFASTMAQQQQELDILRNQVRAAESRLHEVIDALPAGVAIYDNQDRLLAYNREVARVYPYRGDGSIIGESYETLLRRALVGGHIPEAVGREEEWLALRLASRGSLRGPAPRIIDGGPGVHVCETRTPSGYLVMARLDIAPMLEKGWALERANEQLVRLSTIDGLIGIANRRQFEQTLRNEWQRCARNQTSLALLMIDIDLFKRYNDHYGHLGGDECLRQVARIVGLCVKRSGELVARYGGDTFAVLLPGTDAAEARRVAQRCLLEMLNARIPHADSPVSACLTISIGVAAIVAAPGLSSGTLVEDAQAALAQAKQAGRARLEVADPSPVSAPASLPAPL